MSKLNSFIQKDYSGGLNDTDNKREIKRNEASLLRNWDITEKGSLKRRDGTVQVGNDFGADEVNMLASYYRSNGSKDLLCIEDTSLRYLNGSTWSELDSGFTQATYWAVENVMVEDKIFMGSEDNQLHYWDRVATTLNSCLTDLGAGVPHGNVMRWHKNHMFHLNNVNVSGTKYSHRLYWSALGDPETYDTTSDFFEIPGDGRAITMMDMGDNLVLFKERAIQFLSGWGDTDWRLTASSSNVANVDERVGCVAPRGLTRVGNEIWFIDDEGLIRRLYQTDFDAFRRDIICNKIMGTISSINKTHLAKACAWTYNDKVYFAVPTSSATENNTVLVYDIVASRRTEEEAWTIYTGWTPSVFCDYQASSEVQLYWGANADGDVFVHDGDDDNGVAIDARWDGKEDDYDSAAKYKRYKYGYITGETVSGDVTVNIYGALDVGGFTKFGELDLIATGEGLGPTGTFRLGPTGTSVLGGGGVTAEAKFYPSAGGADTVGKRLTMSVRHAVVDEQPIIGPYTIHFKERGLR